MTPKGENHHRAQLTDRDVDLIRRMSAEGIGYARLARIFETSKSNIQSVVTCRTRAARVD